MTNPYYKDCPARHPACHDHCPQFAAWRKEHAKETGYNRQMMVSGRVYRYGYGEITADRRDKLTDLWEAREAAKNSRKGSDKYTDLVTEMLETAIRRVGNEYADMLFEYDQQRREAEKQCEQMAMEGMMKK